MFSSRISFVLFMSLFCAVSAADAATIYVPDDYASIQEAIDASADGDTIIVRPGRFYETIDFKGKAVTLTSEKGPEATVIDAAGLDSVVLCMSGEGRDTVLDGFTLTHGNMAGHGGGVYCYKTSPTIRNNIIADNEAYWSGGGISCFISSSPWIAGNVITGNKGIESGGGIYAYSSSPVILNNVITWNEAGGHSGFYSYGGNGGGVCCEHDCTAILANNIICHNTATEGDYSYPAGGGFYSGTRCDIQLVNCTLFGNMAFNSYNDGKGGGIYAGMDCSLDMVNSIAWGNFSIAGGQDVHLVNNVTFSTAWSDIAGGESAVVMEGGCVLNWGAGMIDADPLFVAAADSDYHITYDSPCRDAGLNAGVFPRLAKDMEGDSRIAAGIVDMGADEFALHLYCPGDAVPGRRTEFRITGAPGTFPVIVALAPGVQDPPLHTPWGDLRVLFPPLATFDAGVIPAQGVLSASRTIPITWSSGEQHPLQALAGRELTNILMLTID